MMTVGGGVGLFIREHINYKICEDLSIFVPHVIERLFVEIECSTSKNKIVGIVYRPNTQPRADIDIFSSSIYDIMDLINRANKIGVVMGDFNIDLLKCSEHGKTNEYLDNVFSRGFVPLICRPTRVTNTSATLIDHIYTNSIHQSCTSGIIITDVADHFGTFHLVSEKVNSASNTQRYKRFFSENNVNLFRLYLQQTDFTNVINNQCADGSYNKFLLLYKKAFDQAFPLKLYKPNRKFIRREPWVTPGLLASSRSKAKLFHTKLDLKA